ncbi:flagellar hook-associated protein 2 [Granulicella aggregans]|uniref:Flagellar hook-associated protein 2 n=1 Tax=Granulicella aggregans TaxID=474949 RepID=A0A7W7ZB53_9BACT|nr:flagellar filament capping protein FliD [Granulicella aggregans]MBB5056369.1 flagellar hook-associated protein 2 [Granulicella aggregans]
MSTTSSTLTSVLSALGGSTGIDVTSAVASILYADRAPERGWQAQQTALASQTSAINALNSDASALSDALSALQSTTGALSTVTATSSNTSLLTATATDGTTTGNHVVTISNLASTGSWYSAKEGTSSTQLPTGSFSITVGSTTTSIPTGSGSVNTLDQLAASINGQALGVTASVVTDSSGARLALVSTVSGAAGDFSIATGGSIGFTRSGTGTDASLTVDGVPLTSSSNTVTGAINGVTLNLLGAAPASADLTTPATPIALGLAPDTSAITSAVNAFVTAYNNLITDTNTTITYNKSTQTGGILQTDSAAQSLQSALLASTNYSATSGSFLSLDSLGISTKSDGTLTVDTTKLTTAIQSNNSALTTFFQGTAVNGFAASLTSTLNTYTDPTQGAFTVDLQSISSENKDLTDQISTLEVYLASQQTILTAQYNAADIAIQQLPQKLKQINALLNPNSTSS